MRHPRRQRKKRGTLRALKGNANKGQVKNPRGRPILYKYEEEWKEHRRKYFKTYNTKRPKPAQDHPKRQAERKARKEEIENLKMYSP